MTRRLKVLRRQQQGQQLGKIKDLMDMFKLPRFPSYQYQPMGGSSLSTTSNLTLDPKTQTTKDLDQMFHFVR